MLLCGLALLADEGAPLSADDSRHRSCWPDCRDSGRLYGRLPLRQRQAELTRSAPDHTPMLGVAGWNGAVVPFDARAKLASYNYNTHAVRPLAPAERERAQLVAQAASLCRPLVAGVLPLGQEQAAIDEAFSSVGMGVADLKGGVMEVTYSRATLLRAEGFDVNVSGTPNATRRPTLFEVHRRLSRVFAARGAAPLQPDFEVTLRVVPPGQGTTNDLEAIEHVDTQVSSAVRWQAEAARDELALLSSLAAAAATADDERAARGDGAATALLGERPAASAAAQPAALVMPRLLFTFGDAQATFFYAPPPHGNFTLLGFATEVDGGTATGHELRCKMGPDEHTRYLHAGSLVPLPTSMASAATLARRGSTKGGAWRPPFLQVLVDAALLDVDAANEILEHERRVDLTRWLGHENACEGPNSRSGEQGQSAAARAPPLTNSRSGEQGQSAAARAPPLTNSRSGEQGQSAAARAPPLTSAHSTAATVPSAAEPRAASRATSTAFECEDHDWSTDAALAELNDAVGSTATDSRCSVPMAHLAAAARLGRLTEGQVAGLAHQLAQVERSVGDRRDAGADLPEATRRPEATAALARLGEELLRLQQQAAMPSTRVRRVALLRMASEALLPSSPLVLPTVPADATRARGDDEVGVSGAEGGDGDARLPRGWVGTCPTTEVDGAARGRPEVQSSVLGCHVSTCAGSSSSGGAEGGMLSRSQSASTADAPAVDAGLDASGTRWVEMYVHLLPFHPDCLWNAVSAAAQLAHVLLMTVRRLLSARRLAWLHEQRCTSVPPARRLRSLIPEASESPNLHGSGPAVDLPRFSAATVHAPMVALLQLTRHATSHGAWAASDAVAGPNAPALVFEQVWPPFSVRALSSSFRAQLTRQLDSELARHGLYACDVHDDHLRVTRGRQLQLVGGDLYADAEWASPMLGIDAIEEAARNVSAQPASPAVSQMSSMLQILAGSAQRLRTQARIRLAMENGRAMLFGSLLMGSRRAQVVPPLALLDEACEESLLPDTPRLRRAPD